MKQEPCNDAISREEAINKINTLIAEYIPLMPTGWTLPLNIARTINELPPVTSQPITLEKAIDYLHEIGWMQEHDKEMAQPKVGEWLEKEVHGDNVGEWQSARCSVCDKYHTTPYMYYFDNYKFCPNCGAKMEVEK